MHCFEGQGISTRFWAGGISKGIKPGMAFQVQVYDLRLLFLYRACQVFASVTMFTAVNAGPLLHSTHIYDMK